MDRAKLQIVLLVLAGAALLCVALYPLLRRSVSVAARDDGSVAKGIAELGLTEGDVSVRRRDRSSWERAGQGMSLFEGDLVQTGGTAKARIKYKNGDSVLVPPDTLFSIRSAGKSDATELPLSAGGADRSSRASSPEKLQTHFSAPARGRRGSRERRAASDRNVRPAPTLEIHRIIPYGRSLELIGQVDPGSSLVINGEVAEVAADGSFKHFTKQFPTSARSARLTVKATDLAGRHRTLSLAHDFGADSEEK